MKQNKMTEIERNLETLKSLVKNSEFGLSQKETIDIQKRILDLQESIELIKSKRRES